MGGDICPHWFHLAPDSRQAGLHKRLCRVKVHLAHLSVLLDALHSRQHMSPQTSS